MQKPVSITVLGILNLIFAGLGILGGCYGMISPLILKQTNPAMADLYTGTYLIVTVAMLISGLVSKSLMAASGIGLLQGKAWGRRVGLIWAVVSIVLGLVLIAVNLAYIMPLTIDAMKTDMQNQAGNNLPPGFTGSMDAMMTISTVIGGLIIALPYQITFLVLINRAAVRDYFAGRGADDQPTSTPPPTATPNPW